MTTSDHAFLRALPPINDVLSHESVCVLIEEAGRPAVLEWAREEIDQLREDILQGDVMGERESLIDYLVDRLTARGKASTDHRLDRVINATGVILHTGLGRAPLSQAARNAVSELGGASNVEVDLDTHERRYRGHQLQPVWHTLTGAEDSLIVNNNAAATLLTLQALCSGREVLISRGQLIEIGGSFRLPDIFALSGAILREVGTTNRTRLEDYRGAIGPETAAIMHVHTSNYRVVGFTTSPGVDALAPLAAEHDLVMIDDIGSGSLVDVTNYDLPTEPTFIDSLDHEPDVVLGSGDKLLGGPQCGIILGRHDAIEQIRQHPLARAVRVGKLTLAALAATLDAYCRGAEEEEIPTVAMLAVTVEELSARAEEIVEQIGDVDQLSIAVFQETAPVGGGTLPGAELETCVLAIEHTDLSAEDLAQRLRLGHIRVVGRIQHDQVLIDLRSVDPVDDSRLALALRLVAGSSSQAG